MAASDVIRWGILGTANITRTAFLPGLRAAGGEAYAVAGRDAERTRQFAADNGIEHARVGYESVLADDRVDAVYIPLPNSMHAEWTIAALQAGKTVLCEKPLAGTFEETQRVVSAAHDHASLLWEAFVFPFRPHALRMRQLIEEGAIGEVREVHATFHFTIHNRENIRLSAALEGGALNDVGCYCVRLARFAFMADPMSGLAVQRLAQEGVDEEMQGVLTFSDDRRAFVSCGMARPPDTFCRIMGTEGEIRLTNPFHPRAADSLELRIADGTWTQPTQDTDPSFTEAIRHIHGVLHGEHEPLHLAVDDALGNAMGMALLRRSAGSGHVETV